MARQSANKTCPIHEPRLRNTLNACTTRVPHLRYAGAAAAAPRASYAHRDGVDQDPAAPPCARSNRKPVFPGAVCVVSETPANGDAKLDEEERRGRQEAEDRHTQAGSTRPRTYSLQPAQSRSGARSAK